MPACRYTISGSLHVRAFLLVGGNAMTSLWHRRCWLAATAGMALTWFSGCQTYFPETGQTLPSGYYLHHLPQYIPPTPPFPLPREEAGLEQAINQPGGPQVAPVAPAPLPPPVPPPVPPR
jgi:hypothetical protein